MRRRLLRYRCWTIRPDVEIRLTRATSMAPSSLTSDDWRLTGLGLAKLYVGATR
jgi:hypothetical protein